MCRNRSACSLIAATTRGCEWPVVTTAMPAVKSRKRLPSTSVTQQPCPRSMTKGYARVKLGDIALESRSMSAAAFGPGSGVLISGLTGGKHNGRDGEGEIEKGLQHSRLDERRPPGHRRHLQLGGQPDVRDDRLGTPRRRGGAGMAGDARQALLAPGVCRRDRRDRLGSPLALEAARLRRGRMPRLRRPGAPRQGYRGGLAHRADQGGTRSWLPDD